MGKSILFPWQYLPRQGPPRSSFMGNISRPGILYLSPHFFLPMPQQSTFHEENPVLFGKSPGFWLFGIPPRDLLQTSLPWGQGCLWRGDCSLLLSSWDVHPMKQELGRAQTTQSTWTCSRYGNPGTIERLLKCLPMKGTQKPLTPYSEFVL